MSKTIAEILPVELAKDLDEHVLDLRASAVTADSRAVTPGTVFVAVRGGTRDGHEFISQAQQQGAALVIGEDESPAGCLAPYVRVRDSRLALAQLAANFHGNPSHGMLMVGVTGTSGKTTTTYLVESILKAAGHEVGVVGTVAFRYKDKVLDSTHTTPGAVELQALLAEMKAAGCTAVAMEVSSHALKQHRAAGIAFDAMVFTNLSPEHLDFHPDMEDYFNSKAILFKELAHVAVQAGKSPVAAINLDDPYGQRLLKELEARSPREIRRSIPFSADASAELSGAGLQADLEGIRGKASGIEIRSPLTGKFNVSNILAAAAVGRGLGLKDDVIARGIANLRAVPGRLERVPNSRGIHVLVDYAHKPDALEKVLHTLKIVSRKSGARLITVFGCGGDRDRKKRPVMGKLAVELSDRVVITSDNPRTENPIAIIEEILKGTQGYSNFEVEPDRRQAIFKAVQTAQPGDLVLIAGKGHEDYQIIADPSAPQGTRKIHFDDREVAAQALDGA